MTVSDLREVVSWVLPFAHEVVIVEPKELRDEVSGRAKAILKSL
jgi:predicted DNA-binding transcriptional regulator YafY